MAAQRWSGDTSRKIARRILVEGDLVLQTPAHLGNGDGDALTDMPLLVDPSDEKTPLLTGASLAGALRSYLREREANYGTSAKDAPESVLLFGGAKQDPDGLQSPLLVDDALVNDALGVEVREGVGLDPKSHTAAHDRLFDLELWEAGTTFPLRLELLVAANEGKEPAKDLPAKAAALKRALATALAGLSDGGITLGARKRRGYGRVLARNWRVRDYDMADPADLLDWLEHGHRRLDATFAVQDLQSALGVSELVKDRRRRFTLTATSAVGVSTPASDGQDPLLLPGSLLIRTGGGEETGPDMVHLRTRQPAGGQGPVVSGTSLGGALRARALKIAATLDKTNQAQTLVDKIFGVQEQASRLTVEEHVIRNAAQSMEWVQNRVSIDRFTSGARDTALFNQQPAFGTPDTRLTLTVTLADPEDHQIGLLLLLLKDLWTGDLPLGGEASVGRGRLSGIKADLTLHDGSGSAPRTWSLAASGGRLTVPTDEREALEQYVCKLKQHLEGKTA